MRQQGSPRVDGLGRFRNTTPSSLFVDRLPNALPTRLVNESAPSEGAIHGSTPSSLLTCPCDSNATGCRPGNLFLMLPSRVIDSCMHQGGGNYYFSTGEKCIYERVGWGGIHGMTLNGIHGSSVVRGGTDHRGTAIDEEDMCHEYLAAYEPSH